ncbi:hypothetical protein SAMN05443667_101236 [Flavobacterium gillisiae]|uniref:Uncharacterized protein n=1 Tax=Flavobacterium gillisiae TaxID=150146 RepID=A0A1H3WWB1_9FLAO|nr:hypothetical protein SAMN05443667_101236 [Flavobacterium gillisiae]
MLTAIYISLLLLLLIGVIIIVAFLRKIYFRIHHLSCAIPFDYEHSQLSEIHLRRILNILKKKKSKKIKAINNR